MLVQELHKIFDAYVSLAILIVVGYTLALCAMGLWWCVRTLLIWLLSGLSFLLHAIARERAHSHLHELGMTTRARMDSASDDYLQHVTTHTQRR